MDFTDEELEAILLALLVIKFNPGLKFEIQGTKYKITGNFQLEANSIATKIKAHIKTRHETKT